ncbi:MAG: 50S ribosomal protein L18 [Planctomycetota bacterium]
MKKKRKNLVRRHRRVRRKISGTPERPRLCVFRSVKHVYGQIIDDTTGRTLSSASSLSPELKGELKHGGNCKSAAAVGALLARKAAEQNIPAVIFDRGGRKYHGRVKAFADAARKGGLNF